MGIFDQFKMASDMMKNMSPEQIQQLMRQAEESKKMLEDTVRKTLDEEIKKRGLLTRDEAERLFAKKG
jgi:cytochrome c biogenesis protein ResB